MSEIKSSGCYIVSWSTDISGREVLIVGEKESLRDVKIINSFAGSDALAILNLLEGGTMHDYKSGWRSIDFFTPLDELPETDVDVLVRRYDKDTDTYMTPTIAKMTDLGWSVPPATSNVIYNGWMELPISDVKNIIK